MNLELDPRAVEVPGEQLQLLEPGTKVCDGRSIRGLGERMLPLIDPLVMIVLSVNVTRSFAQTELLTLIPAMTVLLTVTT